MLMQIAARLEDPGANLPPRALMLEIGQVLNDKYRIDRLVGKGGMGQVFEGFHLLIDRRVAIKVLLPDVASSGDGAARFASEARAAARINNAHILDVFDAGELPDGSRFMVSEFLDGETLEARLQRGPLTAKETARIVLELLDGLAAAHRAGIAHRDLKPDNIFLCRKGNRDDFVKIIDFGISKFQPGHEQSTSVTTTGVVLGTPQYLSPEQARGDRSVDFRSDLYTVGVIIYRCVAGRMPYVSDNVQALLFKIVLENPLPLAEIITGFDAGFSALTRKAMAKQRETRFQSAEELSTALKAWLDGSTASVGAVADTPELVPGSGDARMTASGSAGTSASLELTAPELPHFARARRRAVAIWVALGLGVLLASAGFLTLRRLSKPSAATAATTMAVEPTAAPAVGEQRSVEMSASNASVSPPAVTSAPAAVASAPAAVTSAPRRKLAQGHSDVSKPQRPAGNAGVPAAKPSATKRPRRDFGY